MFIVIWQTFMEYCEICDKEDVAASIAKTARLKMAARWYIILKRRHDGLFETVTEYGERAPCL